MVGFSASASIGLSFGTVSPPVGPVPGQTFRNLPVPNFQQAVYGLIIRGASPPYPVIAAYVFPLSPESIRKDYAAMTNIYDVAGSPQQGGVQRIVDQFGNSPVTFLIEGTTGWQYHGTDGYTLTGLQSILQLQQMLAYFAYLNQTLIAQGNSDLCRLEFYDYFTGDYWEVVPIGPQGIRQNRSQPLLLRYSFRLAGVTNLAAPPSSTQADPVQQALTETSSGQATSTLSSQLGTSLGQYEDVTLGAPVVMQSE